MSSVNFHYSKRDKNLLQKRTWNDFKLSCGTPILWAAKTLVGFEQGSGHKCKNRGLLIEQMERLQDMSSEKALEIIGELLPDIEEELGLPPGSSIDDVIKEMSRVTVSSRLSRAPIHRWFAIPTQMPRLFEKWTTTRVLCEMQLKQDSDTKATAASRVKTENVSSTKVDL